MRALGLFVLLVPSVVFAAPAGFEETVKPFLKAHCVKCHGDTEPEGQLSLTKLAADFRDAKTIEFWGAVREQLRDGTMPPKDEPAPSAESKQAVLDWLAKNLKAAPRPAIVRRMNRVEHENTLRDLLDLPGLEIKETLPADGDAHGFDTAADALDISYVQMARYMEAADIALSKAAALSMFPEKPEVKTIRYYPQHCEGWWRRSGEGATVQLAEGGPDPIWEKETGVVKKDSDPWKLPPVKAMGTFFHSDPAGLLVLNHDRDKIPIAGMYRIRVSAYAFNWKRGELIPTPRGGSYSIATDKKTLGYFDAPPDKAATVEVIAWLEPGERIHFNGVTLNHGHGTDKGALKLEYQGLAVEWTEVEGPLLSAWPPVARTALFGDLPVEKWPADAKVPKPPRPQGSPPELYTVVSQNPESDANRLLKAFMVRAFRRPVADDEVRPYLALFAQKLAEPASFEEAMRLAQKAILSSAHFVFLSRESDKPDLYALASRLSYFLWSTAPDAELTRLAADGSLGKPEVLRAQTERLLNDPKSRRFVENFTGQWLKLRDINSTQPDKGLYPEPAWESDIMPYTVDSMLEESRLFFAGLVRDDLNATNVIDSRFSYLNEPLAKLYGIKDVVGAELRKMPLPEEEGRGGFLTQASVLKVSANGTTTSPVVRGVFVTERLLGKKINPPPPNITGIDPDVRGVTTIREQLEKHRANAACAACHAKTDPPGFALESFDVVGAWRTKYRILRENQLHREGPAVDPSGETTDGRKFKDVRELKSAILNNPDQIARNLTVKLLTYATGRPLTAADLVEVDEIVVRLRAKNHGVRSLIHEVVQSPLLH